MSVTTTYIFILELLNFSSFPPSPGNPPLPNPYGDTNLTAPVMPVQQLVAEILFVRTSYVKKIIEDCSNSEETVKLLRFSCWENPQFSSTVLSELLWQVNVLYLAQKEIHNYVRLCAQILYILCVCRWHIPTHTS